MGAQQEINHVYSSIPLHTPNAPFDARFSGRHVQIAHAVGDKYWSNRLPRSEMHIDEPELWTVMNLFVNQDTLFVDGGANIGLWSCVAEVATGNAKQVVAVEPSPSVIPTLRNNARVNGNGFIILEKALAAEAGNTVDFHEYIDLNVINSVHHMSERRPYCTTTVETTTIDEIVANARKAGTEFSQIVVKLDVEKSELAALEGAKYTTASSEVLFVYEDHRDQDVSAELTQRILELGMHVYYIDSENNTKRIESHTQIITIRKPPRNGYNFLTCLPNSQFDKDLSEMAERSSRV